MRVLQINKFWGRDRGGIEAVVHAQVGDLAGRGHAVRVLACRPRGTAARPFPAGVEGRELEAPVVWSMPVVFGFGRVLEEWAAACEVVHFHLPFPLAEAAALGIPKRGAWVATLHAEVLGRRGPVQGTLAWLQRRVTERFLRRMDAIVVSSPATSGLGPLRGLGERVRVLPFGFDLEPYFAVERRARSGAGRDRMVVAFVGRLVAYKGVDVLLRAMARERRLRPRLWLEVVGEGRERRGLERLAGELGLAGRVRFRGHVPDAELPRVLAGADVFALPSRTASEAFGVAQVEAMAAGLPVVNTGLGTGTDWVSLDGVTGLTVPPEDAAALGAALARLARDANFRRACGRRARRRARDLFTLERRGAELDALYREVVA